MGSRREARLLLELGDDPVDVVVGQLPASTPPHVAAGVVAALVVGDLLEAVLRPVPGARAAALRRGDELAVLVQELQVVAGDRHHEELFEPLALLARAGIGDRHVDAGDRGEQGSHGVVSADEQRHPFPPARLALSDEADRLAVRVRRRVIHEDLVTRQAGPAGEVVGERARLGLLAAAGEHEVVGTRDEDGGERLSAALQLPQLLAEEVGQLEPVSGIENPRIKPRGLEHPRLGGGAEGGYAGRQLRFAYRPDVHSLTPCLADWVPQAGYFGDLLFLEQISKKVNGSARSPQVLLIAISISRCDN